MKIDKKKAGHLIQTRVPEDVVKRLDLRATKEGLSIAGYMRRLVLQDDEEAREARK